MSKGYPIVEELLHVAQKWVRFWEDDMHKNKAGDRSFSRETGVPPIAGTLCKTIQADLERWSRLTLS
ncbi:hypothetical protein FJV83_17545 [Mesorhizobium sp. WSM4307]|nr:hypothetical protein FJV81_27735 [Mesorhizobium sp. WSM4315]TRC84365.1 hypothetical protein FJV83_17545 [Mesorhizobium sp. WSM4307]